MKLSNTKKILIATTALFSSTILSAQNAKGGVVAPKMPAMPSVSVPSIGNGFYTPSSNGFFTGNMQMPKTPTAPKAPNKVENENSNKVLTNEMKNQLNEELAKGFIGEMPASNQKTDISKNVSSQLTANDMTNLESLGLLGSLSSILAKSNTQQNNAISNISVNENQNNTKMLEDILTELKEIKANSNPNDKAVSFSTPEKNEQKVLRFMADNFDYMKTLKTVYFSKEEADGSFLLTGDLKYSVGGKAHNETFYILFKSAGTETGMTKYNISASVSQDVEFNSFLKRLSDISSTSEIFATRTGNLVTMRIDEQNLKMDVLLAMDK